MKDLTENLERKLVVLFADIINGIILNSIETNKEVRLTYIFDSVSLEQFPLFGKAI
jgi:hypothetical protein